MEDNSVKSEVDLFRGRYPYADHFGEWLGYKIVGFDRKEQSVETSLQIRDAHLSPTQRVHGGVISAFLDFTCGMAVFTTLDFKDSCSTIELKVNYFRPLHEGDELSGNAKVMFRGKRLCVTHGLLIRKGEKQPVAMATGTFNLFFGAEIKK